MPLTRTVSFTADRFNSHGTHVEEVTISFSTFGDGHCNMTIEGDRRLSFYSIPQDAIAALVDQLGGGDG